MLRLPVLLTLLLTTAAGRTQDDRKDPVPVPAVKPAKIELPPTEFPDIGVKMTPPRQPDADANTDQGKKAWAEYQKAWADYQKQFDPPALPKVLDTDKPLARLGKAKLAAVTAAQTALRGRINAGISTTSEFTSGRELSESLSAAADLAFEKPADRLKWYEYRVLMAKEVEQYYVVRGAARQDGFQGVDPPYMFPLASAARLDAEIALLKLKEQIGK